MEPSPKICPIMGVILTPNASLAGAGQQLTPSPCLCVREKCALWDTTHEQCIHVTKARNLEQINDVVFNLIKLLDKKGNY